MKMFALLVSILVFASISQGAMGEAERLSDKTKAALKCLPLLANGIFKINFDEIHRMSESFDELADIFKETEKVRKANGVRRLYTLNATPRNSVVIVIPFNCAPCMEQAALINKMLSSSELRLYNYYYVKDWMSDADLVSQIIVKIKREVRYPFASVLSNSLYTIARIIEASELATEKGPPLVFEAISYVRGRWKPLDGNPNLQFFRSMDMGYIEAVEKNPPLE